MLLELFQMLAVDHHKVLGVFGNSGVADFTCKIPDATSPAGKLKV